MKYNVLPMGDGFGPFKNILWLTIRQGAVWKSVETLHAGVILSFAEECQNNSAKALEFLIAKFTSEFVKKIRPKDDELDMEHNILLIAFDVESKMPWEIEILNFESVAPKFFERLMRGEDVILIKGEDKK